MSLYWIYCRPPMWEVLSVPKGVSCRAFSSVLVQCHLTPVLTLVTFHLLKGELWPLEKWPLILTGPNGAEGTADDRRQMETHMHIKANIHVLVHRHWDTVIEWKTLLCRLEEWQENHGDTLRQSSAYTGNCWDMQVMSVSMFMDPADLQRQISTYTLTMCNQFFCFVCCWTKFWLTQHCLFDKEQAGFVYPELQVSLTLIYYCCLRTCMQVCTNWIQHMHTPTGIEFSEV